MIESTFEFLEEKQAINGCFLMNGRPAICFGLDSEDESTFVSLDFKTKVHPIDIRQKFFYYLITKTNIPLITCLGKAGCGKSHIALGSAIEMLCNGQVDKVYVTKPMVAVGQSKFMGTLPGGVEEKVAPFLDSFRDVAYSMNKVVELNRFLENEDIEFAPIEFLRGRSLENCLFILDEAQNLTRQELETAISRLGMKSKMIILGDPSPLQKDVQNNCNLKEFINHPAYLESNLCASITLTKRMRNPIIDVVEKIFEDLGE